MLFNSYTFLFIYLPLVLGGFFLIGRFHRASAAAWLFGASLVFYGLWSYAYVGLLLASITFNYLVGVGLSKAVMAGQTGRVRALLWFGVVCDLALLAYFKYANFFVSSVGALTGVSWGLAEIVLPVGISFYTFTQIAFLVDAARGEVRETHPVHYGLFVTYFPHLIAGPVLHHKEMMPQFARPETYLPHWENLAAGSAIFVIGLLKKVIVADNMAPYATPVFQLAASGGDVSFAQAWVGALAYTFQLYFDFSAYSDMAVGLSRMFGVRLPLNFDSPYKAVNIIDFWRRWHMTLSRFLRDYLYIALGGNRHGKLRRYTNLFITMLLGGLWHGAAWTFVAWGALHGLFLVINHAWRALRQRLGHDLSQSTLPGRVVSVGVTFLAVVVAWVFFRAESFDAALHLLRAMSGLDGADGWADQEPKVLMTLLCGALLVWGFPNSQQILVDHPPALGDIRSDSRLRWNPGVIWGCVMAVAFFYTLTDMGRVSEFLYFQF